MKGKRFEDPVFIPLNIPQILSYEVWVVLFVLGLVNPPSNYRNYGGEIN